MKILYAIQGTGNGHISRALEIIPILKKKANVDVLISASQWDLKVPFPVEYNYKGMGFVFGKQGGVDISSHLSESRFDPTLKRNKKLTCRKIRFSH
jgi:hypothetical protein